MPLPWSVPPGPWTFGRAFEDHKKQKSCITVVFFYCLHHFMFLLKVAIYVKWGMWSYAQENHITKYVSYYSYNLSYIYLVKDFSRIFSVMGLLSRSLILRDSGWWGFFLVLAWVQYNFWGPQGADKQPHFVYINLFLYEDSCNFAKRSIFAFEIGPVWVFVIYFFLIVPYGMWDLSSPIRDWTWTLAVKVWSPNYWITRKIPVSFFLVRKQKLLEMTVLW